MTANLAASEQQKFGISQFCGPEVQNEVVGMVGFFWRLWERICSMPYFPSFQWLPVTLGMAADPCVSVLPFSYEDTYDWVEATSWIQDDFPRSLVNCLCKDSFPNTATLSDTRG